MSNYSLIKIQILYTHNTANFVKLNKWSTDVNLCVITIVAYCPFFQTTRLFAHRLFWSEQIWDLHCK